MLLEAIGGSLPMAVGIALSPLPVASLIILLMTPQARTNAPAFLLGWIAGILAVGFVVFILPGIETTRGEPTPLSGLMRIILGILLLALTWKQWRRQPRPNEPVTVSKLLARLDQIGTAHSLATGFLFTAINPKNLVLTAAGAATIDSSMLAPKSQIIVLFVFTTIASLSVALPLAAYFLARQRVEVTFARWKDWLIENNGMVLIVLLLVFGTLLIGRGMKILAI
jgi:threonine/homoserine/homoserine lactone efflux protein